MVKAAMTERIQTEAVPVSVAMMMGMMEETGLREMLRREWRRIDRGARSLDGGMAAKAIMGNLFDERTKAPLYNIGTRCARFPHDQLFGAGTGPEQINDESLAARLDAYARIDMPELLWSTYGLLTSHYGIDNGDRLSGDGSNYTVFGIDYEEDGIGTVPKHGGNAKDHSKRLQKNFYGMTDTGGILRYAKAYDGNVSDKAMNDEAIEFLRRKAAEGRAAGTNRRFVLTADCKLCYNDLMGKFDGESMFFVTKVPEQFELYLRDKVILEALARGMKRGAVRKDMSYYSTKRMVDGTERRLVAFCLDGREESSDRNVRKRIDRVVKSLDRLPRRRSASPEEARALLEDRIPPILSPLINVDYAIVKDEKASSKKEEVWRIRIDGVKVDEELIARRNTAVATSVLITNLPDPDAEGVGDEGVSDEDVVRYYIDQYLSEKNFRMMKSGMGVDDVYLRTPGRQDAMLLMVALATQLSNVSDFVLKRELDLKRTLTTKAFCKSMVMSEFVFDRANGTFAPNCTRKQMDMLLQVKGALGIDDHLLMGFRARFRARSA